ncbi:ABC transporter permease [Leeuwenhoekiella marinoflava]|uniref:ABC transport system permease protein n=2 Tax=Leeuwenhoekiella marinoflava TaxID=988 RepID=A0ABY1HQM3_9FLAO|nr:ABC transporter permease [Leeuwenhoekiella marinoflava]RXG31963.1 putative ABC transport system permease protein [Leeuwenhoekiella marinoflava]SHE93107.1 putative ABC transport system permease protein [Leeuwenhoekiella marinoflava DSM 3653]
MLRNYIKIAWRSLLKNKITTTVSLFGLILGVACFMLLGTYILNELRYDRFNEKADRIVYVNYNYKSPSDKEATHTNLTPTAVVPVAKRMFSEVENAVRIYSYNRELQVGTKNFTEKNMVLADEALFDIFSFHFIAGNADNALDNPFDMVITQTTAQKYFGKSEVVGNTILVNEQPYNITGVIEDHPLYSTLQFDIVGSYSSSARATNERWNSANDQSFLLLKSPDKLAAVQEQYNAYIKEEFRSDFEQGYETWLDFVPLSELHLTDTASGNIKTYLYILGAIALLLLIISCVNFTNLMTAKSSDRLREIGVRKVFGAKRQSLIFQFITEAAIVCFIAITSAVALAYLLIPVFNAVTGLNIGVSSWNFTYFSLTITILFLATTLLSGSWPALVLSKFKPVDALQKRGASLGGSASLRKFLIIFQFTISIAFIIATLVAREQLQYIRETDTGFDRSQVVILDVSNIKAEKIEALKAELMRGQHIENVTASASSPVDIRGGYSLQVDGKMNGNAMSVTAAPVDKDFIKTLDLTLLEGQNFNETDKKQVQLVDNERTYAFMLNEKAVAQLGLKAKEAIGQKVNLNGRHGTIKGVLKDFNFASLHEAITPVVLFTEYDLFDKLLIKTAGNTSESLTAINTIWKSFYPNRSFEYHFLDDEYNELYKTEQRTTTILNILSSLTILVSCLGLFGLAVFAAAQRKKEIGIRKVLGASIPQLTALLSLHFLKLVLIALLLAAPLAWYATSIWLQDFAYKITMPYELYLFSGIAAVAIAGLTVSFQAIKAAIANPVKSLRTE